MTGIVLAGGLGRRMGGVDKGLQPLRGRPMIAWVLERLAPQVEEVIINANQNRAENERFGDRVVAVPWPKRNAGLYSPPPGNLIPRAAGCPRARVQLPLLLALLVLVLHAPSTPESAR